MAKCEVKEASAGFKPITFSITIESEDELIELWHRMNMGVGRLNSYLEDNGYKKPITGTLSNTVWPEVDLLLKANRAQIRL